MWRLGPLFVFYCVKNTTNLGIKMMPVYYLIVSVGQEPEHSSVGPSSQAFSTKQQLFLQAQQAKFPLWTSLTSSISDL